MLPDLLVPLSDHFSPLTFFVTLLFELADQQSPPPDWIGIWTGLHSLVKNPSSQGQPIRNDGPQSFVNKAWHANHGRLVDPDCFSVSTPADAIIEPLSLARVTDCNQLWCDWQP